MEYGLDPINAFPSSPRTIDPDSPIRHDVFLDVWIGFQLVGGLILLPAAIITSVVSLRVNRNPTVTNLMLCWAISSFNCCLLFFAGQHRGPEPDKALCQAQSILLYATVPMTATSVFCLVLNLWITIKIAFEPLWASRFIRWRYHFLLGLPYLMALVFGTAAAVLATTFPEDVTRDRKFFYCTIGGGHDIGIGTTIFATSLLAAVLVMETHVAIVVFRNWCIVRNNHYGWDMLRIVIFSFYGILSETSAFVNLTYPSNPLPYIVLATVPLAAFLVFGTQKEILRVWCFWKPPQIDEPYPDLERAPKLRPTAHQTRSISTLGSI